MITVELETSETSVHPLEPVAAKRREFLTPIPDQVGEYLLVIDNTAMEKVQRCPTAGYYYLIFGREAHAKNAALAFGGAIHEGIETYLKSGDMNAQNQAILTYFTENPAPPDEYRTPQNALMVMQHYVDQCKIREDYQQTLCQDIEGLIVERPFELPLGVLELGDQYIYLPVWGKEPRLVNKIHVAWSGRIDRAMVPTILPKNHVADVKTTSIRGDQFTQGFQLSHQTIGYVWAAQQLWPDLQIRDFCLDAIAFKKPTGNVGLMDKGPRGGEPALQFFRAYFEYSQERIDQWAANALTIIEDFVHCLVRDFFPLYTNHCFNKFGRCPYFDIDTIDNPELRIRMLQSDAYKDVTWDPTIGR